MALETGKTSVKTAPLWEQYAHQFPVRERLIYLNHAAVAPLAKPAADAMKELVEDCQNFGSLHYDRWLAAYEGLRVAAARLIGADSGEIALLKNTSEGIATVAMGLDWKPGDRVVAFQEEFPANYFPWKKLERRGVRVTWLSIRDSLERIDEACRGARLLAISFVQYLGGYRAPLEAIGEICKRRGCIYLVDAIQGLGAFPVRAKAWGIDALAADGHKWLLGPEGCGVLYIGRELQERVEPVEFGWMNVASYADYGSRDMRLRGDAGRYECGTLNTVGCFGLRAAIEFLLEVGVERISEAVGSVAGRLAQGVEAKGYELMERRTPETGAGIVSFRKAGWEAAELVGRLRAAGIATAARNGWVRASPHFYVSPGEIERVVEELP
ncbi:MAG TPA: aminotransferase class V-fold PLP-dependent enzyme [Bryobacteraceae bacterium]|nr:aminotransferase class V-fold PLP-dependent enzyme [Bryobacteraceae bacterium]